MTIFNSFPINGVSISNLPPEANPQLTDVIPLVQSGITYMQSLSAIQNLFKTTANIVESIIPVNTVSLTLNTDTNITSINLTAGIWHVSGNVCFNGTVDTGVIMNSGWISPTSATLPSSNMYSSQFYSITGDILPYVINPQSFVVPTQILNLSNATTVYLSVRSTFINSTSTAGGSIVALQI